MLINNINGCRSTGFTLIELICVIVLAGALSAVAIPRFIDMRTEARIARMQSLAGAISSAASIYSAKWQANATPATLTIDDGNVIKFIGSAPSAYDINKLLIPGSVDSMQQSIVNGNSNGGYLSICYPTISDEMCGTGTGYCSIRYTLSTSNNAGYLVDTTRLTTANCSK